MKTLEMKEMEMIEGGQVETCLDLMEVLSWLIDNGHNEQYVVIRDQYYDQYCGPSQ